jgi:signal transduction histidine kinase
LLTRELSVKKREEFYGVMMADADRLLGTVEQVLQAGRTREKDRGMKIEEFDLVLLMDETIQLVRSRHHLGDGAIRFSEPSAPVKIAGDRDEIQTAFTNLLDNAVKYSGDEPRISVRIKPSTLGRAEVFIKDNGVGIAAADLKRIFKRFYRASTATKTKGTGLGLSIVRAIVVKHGGRVGAESKGEGKGSTFWVQLPRS